ncbi:MAG: hypothetical protein A2958_02615 [Candidatus Levybacteria bacterium RIFCSPLOWO2_01_FULL_38_13]|nr:MAG: hypothetical protein A2629_03035 [Candidatus Levybacteria bacterium RIFCSPHIGHO2_01_FULL_41_15]OGH35230.1 MAG: hypothetical protein A2958_02615 [Candidatus Levybacteria bacterium RIFCSPLOWO2_01_FULL_38_13]
MNFRRKARMKGNRVVKTLVKLTKREKFIFSVIILSVGLFIAEHLLGKSGIYTVFTLAVFADIFLFIALYNDLKENFYWQVFILPFFFSLAFGLFFFLAPARYLTRIFTTSLYAIGLYSLYLSQNIFTVSSIRTIALLSSARTVSFVITIVSYFFLSNVLFSLHLNFFPFISSLFLYTFPLVIYSVWIHTLEKNLNLNLHWSLLLTLLFLEVGGMLWLWPSTPTVLAIFLTGVFYTVVGLSQVWIDRRLFKSIMWEYIWVACVVLVTLLIFTSWRG